VGFKMMAYPAILDKMKGTPIKVRRGGRERSRREDEV
jgi:hypothetical protein